MVTDNASAAGLYAILEPIPLFISLCMLLCGLAFGTKIIEYTCMAITIALLLGLCILG